MKETAFDSYAFDLLNRSKFYKLETFFLSVAGWICLNIWTGDSATKLNWL